MTTLPQTISSRPRPVQSVNGVPALASPMLPPLPFQPPAQAGMSGSDILRVLRQNLWLFLLTIVLAAAAGYGINIYLKKYFTMWRAEGRVEVQLPRTTDPTGQVVLNETGRTMELEILLQNQAQLLTNVQLLNGVLTDENSYTRRSAWLNKEASVNGVFDTALALELLQENFRARPVEGSSMIVVSMDAGDREEARQILTEIVNRRLTQVRDINARVSGRTGDFFANRVREQSEIVARMEGELKNMRASMNADDAGDGGALGIMMMQLARDQSAANSQFQAIQGALRMAQDQVQRGAPLPEVEMQVQVDPILAPYRQQVMQYDIVLLSAEAKYGPNSETVKGLQRELDIRREQLAQREDDLRARLQAQYVDRLQQGLAAAKTSLDAINKQIQDLNAKAQAASDTRAEIKRREEALKTANDHLAQLKLQADVVKATSNERPQEDVNWAVIPLTPMEPSFPKLPLTIGVTVILGLGLAVGLAFLREMLDTSVRSPRDIARVGQMTVLGIIPDESADPEAGDPLELTIANAPHSMTAEQFRIVRSRLGHVAPLETTRTILITSPQPDDGTTTVACNLAAGMALNGRRILLVDANFRRPGVHEVFNLANDAGLAEALADADRFDELVRETGVPNLFVLTSGPRPGNPTELIEGAAFTDVVDRALEQFDHVIFDSGPILFVSETGALAPQCDGVVSVVRARRSTRGLLSRMRDTLKSLNVEHLGVVLNGMKHHAGGYYNRNIKTYYAYQSDGRR